jgi:hypothetical protein
VVREVGRDRFPDDESLERGEYGFFGHDVLPRADGVS